jgi:hypothetical protein
MQLLRVLPPFLTDAFMGPLAAAGTDFLSFARVSHLLHERLRFDQARRAPPILLGRHAPNSTGVGSAPLSGGPFPVVAAAHVLSPFPGGPSQSGSRRRTTAAIGFRCFQPGHLAPDCMGTRVDGCRSCRTAQHTVATCPLGGVAPSPLLQAPSSSRASAPAGVTTPASTSLMASAPPAPQSRAIAHSVDIVGAVAAVTSPRSDLTVDLATELNGSNTSSLIYFSPSTIPLTEPTVLNFPATTKGTDSTEIFPPARHNSPADPGPSPPRDSTTPSDARWPTPDEKTPVARQPCAPLSAYIQGQRRQHSKTSSSTKARSTRAGFALVFLFFFYNFVYY